MSERPPLSPFGRTSQALPPRSSAQRLGAWFTALSYLLGSHFGLGLALAQPETFSRWGAGRVSAPLQVFSFGAQGFGDLEQAVNLATGNLYVGAGGLGHNNQLNPYDEQKGLFAGNWNMEQRLRLYGFGPNLLERYRPPSYSPPPHKGFRLASADAPPGPEGFSGLVRAESTPPGRYKVSFEARIPSGANLSLTYGLDEGLTTDAVVSGSTWQSFSQTFDNYQTRTRLLALFERTPDNPAWDVRNLSVQRLGEPGSANTLSTPNRLTQPNLGDTNYWSGYPLRPVATNLDLYEHLQPNPSPTLLGGVEGLNQPGYQAVGVKPPITPLRFQFNPQDYTPPAGPPPGQGASGLVRNEAADAGVYEVRFEGRAEVVGANGAPLQVSYGLGQGHLAQASLKADWQSFTTTFSPTSLVASLFQIFEQTAGNIGWQVRNISVRRQQGGTLGANLITDPDLSSSYWSPYYLKPPSQKSFVFLSGDATFPGLNLTSASGVRLAFATPPTTQKMYQLTFKVRATAALTVKFGSGFSNNEQSTLNLTPTWQSFSVPLIHRPVAPYNQYLFSIYENTPNNPPWELQDVSIKENLGWNPSGTLYGPELVPTQDFSDARWLGLGMKPPLQTSVRLASADHVPPSPYVDPDQDVSGVAYPGYVPSGRYVVSFEGRTLRDSLPLEVGVGDAYSASVTLTPQWQSLSRTFDVTNPQASVFKVFERTPLNPAWEIGRIVVQRVGDVGNTAQANAPNLIAHPDLGQTPWVSVPHKPLSLWTVQPITRLVQLGSADWNPTPTQGPELDAQSGVMLPDLSTGTENRLLGRYRVRFTARSVSGSLRVWYGLDEYYLSSRVITPTPQTLTLEIDADRFPQGLLRVFERSAGNPAWEISDLSVERLENYVEPPVAVVPDTSEPPATAPPTLTLGVGDGTVVNFARLPPPSIPWDTLPTWIAAYRNRSKVHLYQGRNLGPSQQAKSWIVLIDRGAGMRLLAHYYGEDGSRASFYGDGEYADFLQTPTEQAQGVGIHPDGLAVNCPKTELTYAEPDSGRLRRVRDAWGRITDYTYVNPNDPLDSRVSFIGHLPLGQQGYARFIRFAYANGLLTQVNFSDLRTFDLSYNADGHLTQLAGPDGTTTYTYSGTRIQTVSSPGYPPQSYAYGTNSLTVTQGVKIDQYTFNSDGQVSVHRRNGQTWEFAYNDGGQLVRQTAPGDQVTTLGYDAWGNLISQSGTAQPSVQLQYDRDFRLVLKSTVGARTVTDTTSYITSGPASAVLSAQTTTTAPGFSVVHQSTYSDQGLLTATSTRWGSQEQATTYSYGGAFGDLPTTIVDTASDAPEVSRTLTYDLLGNVLSDAAAGRRVERTYDAFGNPLTEHTSGTGSTLQRSWTYTPGGRVQTAVEAGRTTTYSYQGERLSMVEDPTRKRITLYDNSGRVNTVDEDGWRTTYGYNGLDQLVYKATPADDGVSRVQHTYTYHPTGEVDTESIQYADRTDTVTNTLDAQGRITRTEYGTQYSVDYTNDADGQPLTITDSRHGTTTLSYDGLGQLASRREPTGLSVTYTNNAMGKVLSEVRSDIGTVTRTFDGRGQLTTQTARGIQTQYTYNALGHAISETGPMGTRTMGRDLNGNLTSVTDYDGRTRTLSYDALGHLLSETDTEGLTRTYGYSGDDLSTITEGGVVLERRSAFKNGAAQTVEKLSKDALMSGSYTHTYGGKVLSGPLVTNTYDPRGNLLSSRSDGVTTTYTYDWSGRMKTKTEQGGYLPFNGSYEYDAQGNLTLKVEQGQTTTYAYYPDNRLQSETGPSGSRALAYDPAGNLTGETLRGVTITRTYRPDGALSSEAGPNYSISYTYDARNLRESRSFSGNSEVFALVRDGQGRQLDTTAYTTRYEYDALGRLTRQYDEMGGATQNEFNYTYTPSGKMETARWNVQVKVQNRYNTNKLWSWGGQNGVLLAGTVGSLQAQYTPRGHLSQVTLSESGPHIGAVSAGVEPASDFHTTVGKTVNQTLTYTSYASGQRRSVTAGGRTTTYDYDDRGRVTQEGEVTTAYSGVTTTKTAPYGKEVTKGGLTVEAVSPEGTTTITHTPTGQVATSSTVGSQTQSEDGVTYVVGTQQSTVNTYNATSGLLESSARTSSVTSVTATPPQSSLPPLPEASSDTVTYTYDNGYLKSESHSSQTNLNVTYTLDPLGKRLAVSGGTYDGFSKRYDAEGRVAEFYRAKDWVFAGGQAGVSGPAWYQTLNSFRYDPFGQQVLSSEGGLAETKPTSPTDEHSVDRNYTASVFLGGEVQMMRHREGGWSMQHASSGFWIWYRDWYEPRGGAPEGPHRHAAGANNVEIYNRSDLLRFQTYTLQDGLTDKTAWNGLVYFDTRSAAPETADPGLEKAGPALSSQLGLNPLEVQRGAEVPELGIPQVSDDPGEAAPVPAFGVRLLGVLPPEDGATPPLGAPGAQDGEGAFLGVLEPATSALPPALQSGFQAQAVHPEGDLLLPDIGGTTIAEGGGDLPTVPEVGASVQDAPRSEQPTSGLQPSGGTLPPLEWGDGNSKQGAIDVKALWGAFSVGCICDGTWDIIFARDANDAERIHRENIDARVQQQKLIGEKARDIINASDMAFGPEGRKDAITLTASVIKSGASLAEQEFQLELIAYGMTQGSIGPKELNDLAAAGLHMVRNPWLVELDRSRFAAQLVFTVFKDDLISAGIDFIPVVGTIKSGSDLFTGYDGVAQTSLGNERYLALLALIPFAKGGAKGLKLAEKMQAVFGKISSFAGRHGLTFGKELGEFAFRACVKRGAGNSFSGDTPVLTSSGLVPIDSLRALDGTGNLNTPEVTQVWTYNEQTGQHELKPVGHVFIHQDPQLTYLLLEDSQSGALEPIITTPEHPFYVQGQGLNLSFGPPAPSSPTGELGPNWVGAGQLKVGDVLKTVQGSGRVVNVTTVAETRVMYNLDVVGNDNFFVGGSSWLVHNEGNKPPIDPKTGLPLVRDPITGLLKPQPPLAPLFSGQPDLTGHAQFRLDVTNRQLPASQQWDILTNGTPHYDTKTGNFVYIKGNKAVVVSGDGQRVVTIIDNISSNNQIVRAAREKWLPTDFVKCE